MSGFTRKTVQLSDEEVERIVRLRPVIFEDDPAHRARGPLTDSDVIRIALIEGLALMEKRYGVDKPEYVLPDGVEEFRTYDPDEDNGNG